MSTQLTEIFKRTLKTFLRDAYFFPLDIKDSLLGRRDAMTPPRRLIFVGDGDFKQRGDEFFRYFVELGGLKPEDRILDVGCGIGRMAVPLTRYLTKGTYEGFDIVPRGIRWCNRHITSVYPNFHFQLADVYNKWYNSGGTQEASVYRFPFSDRSFDFVFLTSVFTHMLPADLENYFSEIVRVLRPMGRVFITYFLVNPESTTLLSQGRSTLNFSFERDGYFTVSESHPETAVAYREEYVMSLYQKWGLDVTQPIRYGSWCGRGEALSYQDIVLAQKKKD